MHHKAEDCCRQWVELGKVWEGLPNACTVLFMDLNSLIVPGTDFVRLGDGGGHR